MQAKEILSVYRIFLRYQRDAVRGYRVDQAILRRLYRPKFDAWHEAAQQQSLNEEEWDSIKRESECLLLDLCFVLGLIETNGVKSPKHDKPFERSWRAWRGCTEVDQESDFAGLLLGSTIPI